MGWTGGQYSLYRSLLGLCLLGHGLACMWPVSTPVLGFLVASAAVALMLGAADRAAASIIAILLPWTAVTAVVETTLSAALLCALLLLHCATPPGPYGSWAARGRVDPRGQWRMPAGIYEATWALLVTAYLSIIFLHPQGSGPADAWLAVAFLGAAAWRPWRPAAWAGMFGVQASRALVFGDAHASMGLLFAQALAFSPAWIAARTDATAPVVIFYDSGCALCHGAVRFVAAEERDPCNISFAPLDGTTFAAMATTDDIDTDADSIVVQCADGSLLQRWQAVRCILMGVGGIWAVPAHAAGIVPQAWGDRVYDLVADNRYRTFGESPAACPILPPRLRNRMLA